MNAPIKRRTVCIVIDVLILALSAARAILGCANQTPGNNGSDKN
jgi:hypothetical protein